MTEKSRGFGFIEFKDEECATNVQSQNCHFINKRKVYPKFQYLKKETSHNKSDKNNCSQKNKNTHSEGMRRDEHSHEHKTAHLEESLNHKRRQEYTDQQNSNKSPKKSNKALLYPNNKNMNHYGNNNSVQTYNTSKSRSNQA